MHRLTPFVFFCALGLLFPRVGAAQAAGAEYGLRPGDRITVNFFTAAGVRLDEVGGQRIVDRNGEIYLPYVGTVQVQGLEVAQVRERVRDRFASLYDNPVVDVTVQLRVNITGSVRIPGSYFLDPTSTVVDALAQAGGAGAEVDLGLQGGAADPSRVRLVRDGQTRTLNLVADQASPDVLALRIQSGDWLHVPPQSRSRTRENIAFASSILGLVTSVAAVIVLATR